MTTTSPSSSSASSSASSSSSACVFSHGAPPTPAVAPPTSAAAHALIGPSGGGGPNFSLEVLATLLARGAAANQQLSCPQAFPPPHPSMAPSSIPQSLLPPGAIQQLLRATNHPLLSANTSSSSSTPPPPQLPPSAAFLQHALLMAAAAAARAHAAPASGGMKLEQEQDELEMGMKMEEEEGEMEEEDGTTTALCRRMDDSGVDMQTPLRKTEPDGIDVEIKEGDAELDPDSGTSPGAGSEKLKQEQNGAGGQPGQRRQRVGGGSSVKTAEVWRFFTQRPPPEQAATCQICQKTIKATNSSTTGMIRHLRSCHQQEFQELQKARYLKNLKNDAVEREKVLLQLQIGLDPRSEASLEAIQAALESSINALQNPQALPAIVAPFKKQHSVDALINGGGGDANNNGGGGGSCSPSAMSVQLQQQHLPAEQRQLLEQIENFKTCRPTSTERVSKAGKDATEMAGGGKRMAEDSPKMGMMVSPRGSNQNSNIAESEAQQAKRRKPTGTTNSDEFGVALGAFPATPRTPSSSSSSKKLANGRKLSNNSGNNLLMMTTTTTTPSSNRTEVVEQHNQPQQGTGNGPGFNPEQQPQQHQRINDQIGAMVLVEEMEFLLDRVGFRQFIQAVLPGYQMPPTEHFRAQILPRVARQLHGMALFREELQRNNPFGLPPSAFVGASLQHNHHNQSSSSPPCCSSSTNNNSVISPSTSSTEESGFHEESGSGVGGTEAGVGGTNHNGHGNKLIGLDELVQQAAFHSQNISRSFTYSIDLNGDAAAGAVGVDASGKGSANAKEEDSDTTSSDH